jgi:hypothetical protein
MLGLQTELLDNEEIQACQQYTDWTGFELLLLNSGSSTLSARKPSA